MHGVFNRRKHHHAQQRISNLVIATLQVQRNGNKKHKQRAVPKSPASSLQGHHGRHTYVTYVTIFHKIMIDWGWLRCNTVSQAFSKTRHISVVLITPRPPIRPQHGQGRNSWPETSQVCLTLLNYPSITIVIPKSWLITYCNSNYYYYSYYCYYYYSILSELSGQSSRQMWIWVYLGPDLGPYWVPGDGGNYSNPTDPMGSYVRPAKCRNKLRLRRSCQTCQMPRKRNELVKGRRYRCWCHWCLLIYLQSHYVPVTSSDIMPAIFSLWPSIMTYDLFTMFQQGPKALSLSWCFNMRVVVGRCLQKVGCKTARLCFTLSSSTGFKHRKHFLGRGNLTPLLKKNPQAPDESMKPCLSYLAIQ